MEMKQKSIKKNMVMSTILTMSNFLFPLITFTYVSRVLTPTGTGKVAFASSVLSYFSYIAILGMSTYGPRECAKVRDDKDKLSHLAQELLIINLVSTAIAYITFAVVLITVPKIWEDRCLFIVMSSSLFLKTIGMEWLFQALEEYSYITKRSLLFKSISVILTFLMIRSPEDYILYGILTIFTSSASYLCNFVKATRIISLKKHGKYNLKRHITPLFVLLSASIIVTIYANFDVVMIGFLKTDYDVGLYNAALKIKSIVLSLSTALADVLIPRIAYYYSKGEITQIKNLSLKSSRVSTVLAIPVTVYILMFSQKIILFVCGKEYFGANSTLQVLMVCIFPLIFTYIFGQQLLIPLGKEKVYTRSVFVGMLINLLLNILLIPTYGSFGAAIGTLITEIWNMIYMGRGVPDYMEYIVKNIKAYIYIISLIIAGIFSYIISTFIPSNINVILFLVFTSIVFFGTYYVLLLILKEPLLTSELNRIIKKVRKAL